MRRRRIKGEEGVSERKRVMKERLEERMTIDIRVKRERRTRRRESG